MTDLSSAPYTTSDEESCLVIDRHQSGWLLSLKGDRLDLEHSFEFVITQHDLARLAQVASSDVQPGFSPMFYLGEKELYGVTTEGLDGAKKVRLHITRFPGIVGVRRTSSVDITYEEFRHLGQILTEELLVAAW